MADTATPEVVTVPKADFDNAVELATKYKTLAAQPNFSGIHESAEGIRSRGEGWDDSDAESIEIIQGYENEGGLARAQRITHPRQAFKKSMKSLTKKGYKPYGEFKSLGDFIRFGIENKNDKSKIESRVGQHLMGSQAKSIQGLTTTDGADGGFTVMPEFNHVILERTFGNTLWNKTDNYSVSGNSMTFLASAETSRANGSRWGGLQGYWMPEGGTITKSKPTLREVNLKLGKLAVVVYLTKEIMEDSAYAIEQWVAKHAAMEFEFMKGDALINGIGVGGQPLGWMNSPNLVSVAADSGQTTQTITTTNVENMFARFFAPMIGGAEWYHHQNIMPQLDTMTVGLGLGQVPVFQPPGGMSSAPYGTLKGRPLHPTEFNSTLGTTGDLLLADMGQMLSISKGGVEQAVSMHIEFLTDQLAVRLTMRAAARPWESTPLTPYKGTQTQSSAVALATR